MKPVLFAKFDPTRSGAVLLVAGAEVVVEKYKSERFRKDEDGGVCENIQGPSTSANS